MAPRNRFLVVFLGVFFVSAAGAKIGEPFLGWWCRARVSSERRPRSVLRGLPPFRVSVGYGQPAWIGWLPLLWKMFFTLEVQRTSFFFKGCFHLGSASDTASTVLHGWVGCRCIGRCYWGVEAQRVAFVFTGLPPFRVSIGYVQHTL